jgi:hypothetical protein
MTIKIRWVTILKNQAVDLTNIIHFNIYLNGVQLVVNFQ